MSFFVAAIAMITQMALAIPQPATTAVPSLDATACKSKAIDRLIAIGKNESTVTDCGSTFKIVAIGPAPAGPSRRCISGFEYTIRRTQVVRSGTWWNKWTHASGCNNCKESHNICDEQMNWSMSTTATFSANFDLSTQDEVLSAIQGNVGFNFGYTWGQTTSTGGTFTCHVDPGSVGRIFSQSKMGWADSQVSIGYVNAGCGPIWTNWGDWSENMRSDWPLDGVDCTNYKCSYGDKAGCPP